MLRARVANGTYGVPRDAHQRAASLLEILEAMSISVYKATYISTGDILDDILQTDMLRCGLWTDDTVDVEPDNNITLVCII